MSTNPIIHAYRSLKREITLIASTELKKLNVGEKQMAILFYLAEKGEATATVLAAYTHSDPAAVTRAIRSLEEAGFVKKKADPFDNRRAQLALTAKGEAKARSLERIREEVSHKISQTLGARELKELARLMNIVAEGLARQRLER